LLFEALVGLWILTWIKAREGDPAQRLCAASFSQTGAVVFLQNGTDLGHQVGGLLLSAQEAKGANGLTRRVSSTSVTAISAIGLEANDQIGRT
jgi:hypothetical protein